MGPDPKEKPGAAHPEDSAAYFATRIMKHLDCADAKVAGGDAAEAALHAFYAATEWATMVMKFSWEVDALRGEKVAGGARNSAHATNTKHEETRRIRLDRMRHHLGATPDMSVDSAAHACAAEGLGSAQAIRRQWDRWKEKPDT
jgi:hypothetical protein